MLTVIPYRLLNTLTILISTAGVGVALVDSGFAIGDGLRVTGAVGVTAAGALGLGQGILQAQGQPG